MTKKQIRATQGLIEMYKQNPGAFSDEEVDRLMSLSLQAGIPFEPETSVGRVAKIGLLNLLDSAAFGLMPNSWKPEARTTAEKIAAIGGDVGGLFVGGPAALGKMAVRGAEKGIAKLAAREGSNITGESLAALLRKGGRSLASKSANLSKVGLSAEKAAKAGEAGTKWVDWLADKAAKINIPLNAGTIGKAASSGMLNKAVLGGARWGATLGSHNAFEKGLDGAIEDALGGVTLGAVGSMFSMIPVKNRIFNARNMARLIYTKMAAKGLPYSEEDVVNRLAALASTF